MATIAERIASKVVEDGDCLVWTGTTTNGHPVIRSGPRGAQRSAYVRRAVFVLENGYVPEYVNQSCGNRLCVKPEHLVDGETGARPLTESVAPDWSFAIDPILVNEFRRECATLASRYKLDADDMFQEALIRASVRPPAPEDTPKYRAEKNCRKAADALLRQRKKKEAHFESLEAREEWDD